MNERERESTNAGDEARSCNHRLLYYEHLELLHHPHLFFVGVCVWERVALLLSASMNSSTSRRWKRIYLQNDSSPICLWWAWIENNYNPNPSHITSYLHPSPSISVFNKYSECNIFPIHFSTFIVDWLDSTNFTQVFIDIWSILDILVIVHTHAFIIPYKIFFKKASNCLTHYLINKFRTSNLC